MQLLALVLGVLLTLGGAGILVIAFRQAQAGRRDAERRTFLTAVAALAVGSLFVLVTVVLAG